MEVYFFVMIIGWGTSFFMIVEMRGMYVKVKVIMIILIKFGNLAGVLAFVLFSRSCFIESFSVERLPLFMLTCNSFIV